MRREVTWRSDRQRVVVVGSSSPSCCHQVVVVVASFDRAFEGELVVVVEGSSEVAEDQSCPCDRLATAADVAIEAFRLFRRPPYHHLLDWPAEDVVVGPVVGSATAIAAADRIRRNYSIHPPPPWETGMPEVVVALGRGQAVPQHPVFSVVCCGSLAGASCVAWLVGELDPAAFEGPAVPL